MNKVNKLSVAIIGASLDTGRDAGKNCVWEPRSGIYSDVEDSIGRELRELQPELKALLAVITVVRRYILRKAEPHNISV